MSAISESSTDQRFDGSGGPRKIGPADGRRVDIQSAGVRFMAWSEETGGGFSLVEHPIPPHGLVAPLHKHSREDERTPDLGIKCVVSRSFAHARSRA